MFWLGLSIGLGIGAAAWIYKDPITKWYKGAEDYVADLKAKIEKAGK